MKINHNKNPKNKQIYSPNLKIQLRNYNGTNPLSLALHGMQKQHKNRTREGRKNEISPLKGFLNSEVSKLSFMLPLGLFT